MEYNNKYIHTISQDNKIHLSDCYITQINKYNDRLCIYFEDGFYLDNIFDLKSKNSYVSVFFDTKNEVECSLTRKYHIFHHYIGLNFISNLEFLDRWLNAGREIMIVEESYSNQIHWSLELSKPFKRSAIDFQVTITPKAHIEYYWN